MPIVTTLTSSGSGLNPEDKPITSSAPASSVISTSGPSVVPQKDKITSSITGVPMNEYGANKESLFGLTPYSGETGSGLIDLNTMFDELTGKMGKIATEQMSGVVPEDVQKQLKIMSAEASLSRGLGSGSQASRYIEARDLGLTSLDIQQKGLATAQIVAGMVEQKREFNKNYELNVQQFMQDVRKTDLSATELVESSRRFNVQMKLAASELAANTLLSYHSLASEYASPDTAQSYMDNLTRDVSGIIKSFKSSIY